MLRTSALLFVVSSLSVVSLVGCAHKPAPKTEVVTTSARVPRANVNVSDDLVALCKIQFGDSGRAPKFDYDEATLLPEDRDVLEQVARCVTTGPLKGRKLALVGRADPRGEVEYNMVLGDHRADSVRDYLAKLGVSMNRMDQTSRGELDAQGGDEDGWRRDRRVDVNLK